MKLGIKLVVITLGADGVFIATENNEFSIYAFDVEAVETTVAGDVFNGALAEAISEDKALSEAVRFASAAAALLVTKIWAQPSAPTKKEIQNLLNK